MNVDSPAFLADPYRFYRKRLEKPDLLKVNHYIWSSTRYEVISEILAHPAAGRGNIGQSPLQYGDTRELELLKADNPAIDVLHQWMLFNNPPRHTALRKSVLDVFTHKMIKQLEPMIRQTITGLIDQIKRTGHRQFDLVPELAYPFPVSVICEMLGIPKSDRDQFQQWNKAFAVAVQCDFKNIDAPTRNRLNTAAVELKDYFGKLIPEKLEQDHDDLMTRLATAKGDGLSEDELVGNCALFLFAGQETTTSTLTNSINALLQHRDQYAALVDDPMLIPNAVEECLRYDPPIQMVSRLAMEGFNTNSQQISQGDHFFLFIGAAGRDPDVNSDPESFDIHRKNVKHLAMARGAHHCLGALLARLELKIALEEIVKAFPEFALSGTGKRNPTWLMRGFKSLPVSW